MPQVTVARPGADAPQVNKPNTHDAPWPLQFWRSAVGKKFLMALSGLGLYGFVVAHMIGNLKLYLGQEENGRYAIDTYAKALRTLLHPIMPNEVVLWALRLGLLGMAIVHIAAAVSLAQMNRRARPVGYQSTREYVSANLASRSMKVTGPLLLGYILFHLADLTLGWTSGSFIEGHVHHNVINSLSQPGIALIYAIGNIALCMHLFHGTWSMFQSLGLNNPRFNYIRRILAVGMTGIVLIGNLSFPILIATKIVK